MCYATKRQEEPEEPMGDSYREYLKGKKTGTGARKTRPRRTTAEVERSAAIRQRKRKESACRASAQERLLDAYAQGMGGPRVLEPEHTYRERDYTAGRTVRHARGRQQNGRTDDRGIRPPS